MLHKYNGALAFRSTTFRLYKTIIICEDRSPGIVSSDLSSVHRQRTMSCTHVYTETQGRQDVLSGAHPTEHGTGTHTGPTNTVTTLKQTIQQSMVQEHILVLKHSDNIETDHTTVHGAGTHTGPETQ